MNQAHVGGEYGPDMVSDIANTYIFTYQFFLYRYLFKKKKTVLTSLSNTTLNHDEGVTLPFAVISSSHRHEPHPAWVESERQFLVLSNQIGFKIEIFLYIN